MAIAVLIETGTKKTCASALDWPGWSRSGKDETTALAALATYADRYAAVAKTAGIAFPPRGFTPGDVSGLTVVDRVPGTTGVDWGIPAELCEADFAAVPGSVSKRLAALVSAAWAGFDAVVAVTPTELRKGPRGGGRDRDAMIEHVLGSEAAYARKVGVRLRQPDWSDQEAVSALRAALLEVVGAPNDGGRLAPGKGWPSRYAARRIAWHALDHAWEMADRTPS